MRKLTILNLAGLFFTSLVFAKGVAAITADEISNLIAGYPDGYFTNANEGLKASFIENLKAISSNISLFNTETDPSFKADLGQEIPKDIKELISRTDGCISAESNNPDIDDWLADCQAQNIIYSKLNELLTSY